MEQTEADLIEQNLPAPKRHLPSRVVARSSRWVAELATVFLSVYAAFLFNNYQAHRQEQERREQILAWMEETYARDVADVREERAVVQRNADAFNKQYRAGEMPPLHAFTWHSDYDPSDVSSLLASGGFDLLEVQTVREIKDAEGTVREMVGTVRHDQELSDTYILPNLEKGIDAFYDPATRKLRPTYDWYEDFFDTILKDYDKLQPQLERLLNQIRAERRRNR
jgi:hypothetical protein